MSKGFDTLNTILQGLCSKTTKHSIMLANKTTQKLLKSEAKIALTEQVYQSGNLTAYNGGVKVGKGIQAVRISGCLYINEGLSVNDLLYVLLYKNSVKLATAMTVRANYAGAVSLPVAPFLVPVQEGDTFYMYANNDTYARGNVPAYWQNRIVVESVGGGYSVIGYLQHFAAGFGGVRHVRDDTQTQPDFAGAPGKSNYCRVRPGRVACGQVCERQMYARKNNLPGIGNFYRYCAAVLRGKRGYGGVAADIKGYPEGLTYDQIGEGWHNGYGLLQHYDLCKIHTAKAYKHSNHRRYIHKLFCNRPLEVTSERRCIA